MTKKFAHEAEEKFARILNYYNLDWQYEPKTFCIIEGDDGLIIRGFTPDFYVPEYDTYVEVTVMQKLTRKKKKINATLAKYPHLNIILINRHDIDELCKKYDFLFC